MNSANDILLEYPILKLLLSVLFAILGAVIMSRNKFYKYDSSDMLFAAGIKVYISGVLFLLIGIAIFGNGIYHLL